VHGGITGDAGQDVADQDVAGQNEVCRDANGGRPVGLHNVPQQIDGGVVQLMPSVHNALGRGDGSVGELVR
jgi:hypothetical protein